MQTPDCDASKCGLCGKTKPSTSFYASTFNARGISSICIKCCQDHENERNLLNPINEARERATTRSTQRARFKKYGITATQWLQILAAQAFRCEICYTTSPGGRGWVMDHNHSNGKNRAILCGKCNLALGLLHDEPLLIEEAAKYLRYWRERHAREESKQLSFQF